MLRSKLSLAISVFTLFSVVPEAGAQWISAYFISPGSWKHQYSMPASEIDFNAITHVLHYSARIGANGSIDIYHNDVAGTAPDLISRAHAANRKVLFVVGHAGANKSFRDATSSRNLSTFVSNIVNVVRQYGYDGVDIDWETLDAEDSTKFPNLVRALRSELDKISPRPMLTAAVSRSPEIVAGVQDALDQMNIMAYAFTWDDLGTSWHNAALDPGSCVDPVWYSAVPTIKWRVGKFLKAGVPARKLGLGIPFYGDMWTGGSGTVTGGVTQPCQVFSTAPRMGTVDYNQVINNYRTTQNARWDSAALAPYLTMDAAGSANDKFISYDDEASVTEKVRYGMNNGFGGFMIWELAAGYFGDRPAGQRHPLVRAMTNTLRTPSAPAPSADIYSPSRFGASPTGSLAAGVKSVTVRMNTDENATCRYSTVSNTLYTTMTGSFVTSGGVSHSAQLFVPNRGQTYTYHVRCSDASGNTNPTDYVITLVTAAN